MAETERPNLGNNIPQDCEEGTNSKRRRDRMWTAEGPIGPFNCEFWDTLGLADEED